MGVTPSPSDPMPASAVSVNQEEDPSMERGRAMRGQRGRGRTGFGRGDYGGYNYASHDYGYTGGYGYQSQPGPHSAVPPPNSLVSMEWNIITLSPFLLYFVFQTSQDNPGGVDLYDSGNQLKRKREWGEEGYGTN